MALLDERTRQIGQERYIDGTRRWRSPTLLPLLVCFHLATACLPLLPGTESFGMAPAALSAVLVAVQCVIWVLATLVVVNHGPHYRLYLPLSILDPIWWVGTAVVLIATAGTAASIYWLHLAVFVVLMATTVHRHRFVRNILSVALIGLVGFFIVRLQIADAVFSFAIGGTLLLMQSLSTITGLAADRERARAELIAEQATEDRARWERERIARDLHDGLAAELTAILWRTAAINDPAAQALGASIQSSLASLRVMVQEARAEALTAEELSLETIRVAKLMAEAAGTTVSPIVEHERSGALIPSAVGNAAIRIVQELVRNAITHGKATKITLRISTGSALQIAVTDNGAWLATEKKGHGLENARARVADLAGELVISTAAGTKIELLLPLPPAA